MLYNTTQCRYARSLGGGFEGTPESCWGTVDYTSHTEPTVFFGMYDLRDYIALYRHKGKKWVLWAGSDLRNLKSGFLFNDGKLKWLSKLCPRFRFIVKYILLDAEHWVENEVEQKILSDIGIKSKVCPSWLGSINLPVTYEWSKNPKVYVSCSGNLQKEYGWDVVERIAPQLPMIDFYLYGADWDSRCKNVHIRGRIPKEQMNAETRTMQASLRLNESDGFSELISKAILRGQYCVSRIPYPLIPSYETDEELIEYLRSLTLMYKPNLKARSYYQQKLNDFPWNEKFFNE